MQVNLTLDHIGNVFLYFLTMESWTLSLFMAVPKSVLEATRVVQRRCTYQRPKSPRKIIEPRVLEKKGLFVCGNTYLGKQLLLQINSCCQEVMKNNEMTSPWSNH